MANNKIIKIKKIMKKILGLILIISIVGTTSCKKYLEDAYKNPNLPTYSAPENVLQSCIAAMHRGLAFDSRAIGFYTQNFAFINGLYQPERHGYTPGNDLYGDIWRMHYWNMGFNIIDMIDSSRITGKYDYVAAAYALNAWSWVTTADVHGELPVKQAFEKGRLSFDYDNQNVAYEYALRYCDSSLNNWNRAATMTNSTLFLGDKWFYNGDQSKWKKFVYGMKARIYHRYQKKSTYLSKEVDSVIKYAGLAMSSTNDDAFVKFDLTYPDVTARSFFGPSRNNIGSFRQGELVINIMKGSVATPGLVYGNTTNDPRMAYMFRKSNDGSWYGINAANLYTDLASTPTDKRIPSFWGTVGQLSAPGLGVDTGARTFFRNDSKFPIMTYSEIQFLKAEAHFLKGEMANAQASYKNGINGHFDMLNNYTGYLQPLGVNSPAIIANVLISAADRAAYLLDPSFVPAIPTLKNIMTQKYLALWGWGYVENWVDMRRYNYDEVNIYPTFKRLNLIEIYPDNGGKLAERIRPRFNSEYLWNIDALTAVGGFNPDYHTKKCWFSLP
jgi:Starch-binding associating with outer membrane